jgi:hypothetical protein
MINTDNMKSTFKAHFLQLLDEENVAGGAASVFGAGVVADDGIYDPNASRFTSNDSIYAPGDARLPKALSGVQRRAGISKKRHKFKKRHRNKL